MSISFTCHCGKRLKVDDQWQGQSVTCPACQTLATVPPSVLDDPGFEVVNEPAVDRPLARAKPVKRPVIDEPDSESEDDRDRQETRPRRKKRKRSSSSEHDPRWGARDQIYDHDHYSKPFNERWTNPGVIWGIICAIGGILLFTFVLCFVENPRMRSYITPPCLIIGGILSALRGLGLLGMSDHD